MSIQAKEDFERKLREMENLLQKAREELKEKTEEIAEDNTNILRYMFVV